MRVRPRPTLEPNFAAWDVWRRYVRKKPMNWKRYEMRMLRIKIKTEPAGRSLTRMLDGSEGAWTTVSQ